LGRLSGTCTWLREAATSPAVVAGIAADCAAIEPLSSSLRHIALHQFVATPDSNHLHFQAAATGMGLGSQERLAMLAEYLHRYPDMTVMVDAHCGGNLAPLTRKEERAEMQLSRARADGVLAFLTVRGVDGARIRTAAWGATITEATPGAAFFLEVDGLVVPTRPEYYPSTPPPQSSLTSTLSTSAPASPRPSAPTSPRSSSPPPSPQLTWTPAALLSPFKTERARAVEEQLGGLMADSCHRRRRCLPLP